MKSPHLLALALALLTCVAQARDLTLYMSADGSDERDGTSAAQSVRSLQRALDLATGPGAKGVDEVTIRVAAGRYVGQTGTVSAGLTGVPRIEIRRAVEEARPVFDGEGRPETWLTVAAGRVPARGLTVAGLEVKGYLTAITLNGSRDRQERNVSEVLIRNNAFRDIGQQSPAQPKPSTAAVRLVNADSVQIVNNRFERVRNREQCQLIHAIYVAHGSTGNLIKDNHFEDSCGDSIRTRDGSSGNRIEHNTFVDAWNDAPVSDWYCDDTRRGDCTKKTPECPSFDNELSDNRIEARKVPKPPALKIHGPDANASCALPSGGAARQRFLAR